jgi:hypothetical protein
VCEQRTSHVLELPDFTSLVQGRLSLQLLAHLVGLESSQVSPESRTPLPQPACTAQSLSVPPFAGFLQPGAQQPSPFVHAVICVFVHAELQVLAAPVRTSVVQALPSLQLVMQLLDGSQVSPGSFTLFPHAGMQSTSLLALQPGAQHVSARLVSHTVIAVFAQVTLHAAAVPVSTSVVQALPSLQVVLHLVALVSSQVSPESNTPLPQPATTTQSLSVPPAAGFLQPGAQQPSPLVQAVTGVLVHLTLQAPAVPVRTSVVHALLSLHVVGQLPSHVSVPLTLPSPQNGFVQSLSPGAEQPLGQQVSPLVQTVSGALVHLTLQALAVPVRTSDVQALPSLQVVGQLPSQVSPGSTTPLPHGGGWQSMSPGRAQPLGQHESPLAQVVTALCVHWNVQAAALPVDASVVQALLSLQVAGQLPSQVSPGSTLPSPQRAAVVGLQYTVTLAPRLQSPSVAVNVRCATPLIRHLKVVRFDVSLAIDPIVAGATVH